MRIFGIQKLTLLDFPGKVAATIFLGNCNMRCPFCHNSHLVTNINAKDEIPKSEIMSFLEKRVGVLDGVAITGGEPLCSEGVFDFIKEIRNMGYAIKLDTNGTFAHKLKELVLGGYIDYVAMDIKNSLESYGKTVGIQNFDTKAIQESADFLINGDFPYEFRTTVVKQFHTATDIENMAKRFSGAKAFFLQCFVDSGNTIESGLEPCTKQEMLMFAEIMRKYIPNTRLRGV